MDARRTLLKRVERAIVGRFLWAVGLGILSAAAYVGAGVLVAAAVAGAGFLAFVAAVLVYFGLVGFILARFIFGKLIPAVRLNRLLREAEARQPAVRRRLAAAVDLSREPLTRGTSPELAYSFVDSVASDVDRIPSALPGRTGVLAGAAFSSVALLWAVVFLAFPALLSGLADGFGELAATVEGRNIVSVEPGDVTVSTNSEFEVTVRVRETPEEVPILTVDRAGELSEAPMPARGDGFFAVLSAGRTDFDYWVTSGRERTDRFHVTVKSPPEIEGFRLTVFPPGYTGLPPVKMPDGAGDVNALPGSKVLVAADVSHAERLTLEVKGEEPVPADVIKDRFEVAFTVKEPGAYRLLASSEWGTATTPYFYINPATDFAPTVEVIKPEGDLEVADPYPSPVLRFVAVDDFGVSRAVVKYYNETTGETFEREVPSAAGRREVEGTGDLIFPGLDMFPGDVISYYVEAYDNDTVNGPKAGRSPVYRIKFPTVAEIFKDLNAEMAEELTRFGGLSSDVRELGEKLSKLSGSGDDASRPARAEIRELLKEQERIERALAEAAKELETALKKADEGLITPELAEKMWQLSEMLDAALDEEAKEALEKLRQAMSEVDPQRLQELLEDVRLDQKMLAERLDRMLDILKAALREQTLKELALRAGELADRQDEILSRLDKEGPSLELATEEMSLADAVRELEDTLEESAGLFEDADPGTAEELRKLAQELRRSGTADEAEDAAYRINAGDAAGASVSGEDISAELRELAGNLEKLYEKYKQNLKEELLGKVDRAIERTMTASRLCEELTREVVRGPSASFPGRQERLAEEIRAIRAETAGVAKETLFIPGEVLGALDEAAEEAAAAGANVVLGNSRAAVENDRRALAALNAVTLALLNVRESIAASGSSMGLAEMIERMKALAEAQRRLNEESGSAMTMLPGLQPSMAQALLERLAAEQALIRRELEKTARRGGEYAETLGNASALMEEMEEIEDTLRRGELDEKVLEKQAKLLERMLDAARAMRSKGKSNKRVAEPAKEYLPFGVPRALPARLVTPNEHEVPGRSGRYGGYVPPAYRSAAAEYYRRLAGGE